MAPAFVRAQTVRKTYRIGDLAIGPVRGTTAESEAFRSEMKQLGLGEGASYVVDVRAALNGTACRRSPRAQISPPRGCC